MPTWVDAEHLAQQIYSELLDFATVKWDDHIYGHHSEQNRQIDVSIRWTFNGVERLTIVQVKDWQKRPDVNDVGSFAAVVEDVKASQGIMVSRHGFSSTARTYARNRGIQLHSLHDAQSATWRKVLTIALVWVEWSVEIHVNMTARLEGLDQVNLYGLQSSESGVGVWRQFHDDWNSGSLDRQDGVTSSFSPAMPAVVEVGRPDGTKAIRPVGRVRCNYKPHARYWLGQLQPKDCRGVVDYLQEDSFYVSHLPFSELPIARDENWKQVSDPERIAVDIRGTIVTMELLGLDQEPSELSMAAKYLGP